MISVLDLEDLELHMSEIEMDALNDSASDSDSDDGQKFMSGTGTLTRLSIFFAFGFNNLKRLTLQCHADGGVSA